MSLVTNELDFLNSISNTTSSLISETTNQSPVSLSSTSLEERMLFVWNTIPKMSASIQDAITNPSGLSPKLKATINTLNHELPNLKRNLEEVRKDSDNKKMKAALTDPFFNNKPISSPVEYLVDSSNMFQTVEQQINAFLFLEDINEQGVDLCSEQLQNTYKPSQHAANFLIYPAKKSAEIAQAVFDTTLITIDEPSLPVLGRGGCGTVVKQNILNESYAAKQLFSSSSKLLEQEYHNLIALEHPNIIQLAFVDAAKQTLYLELAELGSLKHQLSGKQLSQQELLTLLTQAADAISFIHAQGYVHRDIKADNILLTKEKTAKISDFGTMIKSRDIDPSILGGTTFYLPPEYLNGQLQVEDATKIDVWGFGLIIWQALKDQKYVTPFVAPPIKGNPERIQGRYNNDMSFTSYVAEHFQGFEPGVLRKQLDPKARAIYDPNNILVLLMEQCLAYNPKDRPSMDTVLRTLKN